MAIELVETVTLGSGGAAYIEITSLPNDASELIIKFSFRGASRDTNMEINSDSGLNYVRCRAYQQTSSLFADSSGGSNYVRLEMTADQDVVSANTWTANELHLYGNKSGTRTSGYVESAYANGSSTSYAQASILGFVWTNNTSDVTTIRWTSTGGNLAEFSSVSVYKVT